MYTMRLNDWAEKEGIAPFTARRWAREGTFPVPIVKTPGGRWIVHDPRYEQQPSPESSGKTVGYARVSSSDQKNDLQRQSDRIKAFLVSLGEDDPSVISEVGSGMNGNRRKLNKILSDSSVTRIVVEHSDRLARMNLPLIKSCLKASGRDLIVIDDAEITDDLVQEITEFMTSVCARIYGRRSAKNRAQAAMKAAENA